ncbi:hypothetical protein [Prosthecochloris sp. SCSIO W1103]|uniref:PD-(D/E)XK nuclease domain-containing protein n=1 Tax=Prosthecochloris sp. SCSIO W1103 TaxID=2992244 RepID=UPI00223CDBC5|nr:hypothetical protein [Prosthecochloris sp. SCSIO W1103]UZJ36619.1 hypothetical protein OO005_07545 [Prosthecochloris sp. SCSIO W1103]
MTEVISHAIASQLEKLKANILSHNHKSDICGLFSNHILLGSAEWRDEWDALCDDDWVNTHFDEKNAYSIAALGYSIPNLSSEATKKFIKAIDILMQRDPFKGPRVSFAFQPITLIGFILGVKAIVEVKWRSQAQRWLSSIIEKRLKSGGLTGYQDLLYSYARFLLEETPQETSIKSKEFSIGELALLEYALSRNIFKDKSQGFLAKIRSSLILQVIKSDITSDVDEKAALIWIAISESLSINIGNHLVSPHYVSEILSRFEPAMKRWRFDSDKLKNPIRWPIVSEREVQDILYLILRSYFNDLIDEEVMPTFGHKFHKPDFAVPSLRLLIEVKYAYQKDDFKKIEQEIMIDTIAYLSKTQDYDKILAFIYDESSSVQEHDITKKDLKKLKEIEDVIIVSRPSQIGKNY